MVSAAGSHVWHGEGTRTALELAYSPFFNTINADSGNLQEFFIVFFGSFFNKIDNKKFKILNRFLLY